MGKLTEALEHHNEEQSIKTKELMPKAPDKPRESMESRMVKELGPLHQWNPKLVVLSDPLSMDAETFKQLRAQILFPKSGKRPRVIMVTSSFPGEGKTFVAANLAVSFALGIDEHVLLIDCDLRRPHLYEMFGYAKSEGLHEYLTGKKSLPELIIRTNLEKLSFLPAGEPPHNPTELLSSSKMEDFLEEVRGRYDDRFIVIDSTPSQVTAEASVLAKHVDGIVMVVMARKPPKKAIEKSIAALGKDKILGMVFNGYSEVHKSYYKYYKKYYQSSQ